MKKVIRYVLLILAGGAILSIGSCTVIYPTSSRTVHHTTVGTNVPPGQMKKMTGEKSAKAYAPGQNKKKKNK